MLVASKVSPPLKLTRSRMRVRVEAGADGVRAPEGSLDAQFGAVRALRREVRIAGVVAAEAGRVQLAQRRRAEALAPRGIQSPRFGQPPAGGDLEGALAAVGAVVVVAPGKLRVEGAESGLPAGEGGAVGARAVELRRHALDGDERAPGFVQVVEARGDLAGVAERDRVDPVGRAAPGLELAGEGRRHQVVAGSAQRERMRPMRGERTGDAGAGDPLLGVRFALVELGVGVGAEHAGAQGLRAQARVAMDRDVAVDVAVGVRIVGEHLPASGPRSRCWRCRPRWPRGPSPRRRCRSPRCPRPWRSARRARAPKGPRARG